jgi:hypothetical protein
MAAIGTFIEGALTTFVGSTGSGRTVRTIVRSITGLWNEDLRTTGA